MSLNHAAELENLLSDLKPPEPSSVPIRPELTEDESRWFLAAVDERLVESAEAGAVVHVCEGQGLPEATSSSRPLIRNGTCTRRQARLACDSTASTPHT